MSGFVLGEDGVYRQPPGYEALWNFFGLSYASWLTLPRVMMHEMPDDWQARMAVLLHEFDDIYNWPESIDRLTVSVKRGNKFAPMPAWLAYRHPDIATIESFKRKTP